MRHLMSPLDFTVEELDRLFDLANDIEKNPDKYSHACEGKKLATCFYEPSTRTRLSFEAALKDGYSRFIMFLHYPPTNILEEDSGFTAMAEAYGAEQVIYAHSHGEARFHDSIEGEKNGVRYSLVSGDYRRWQPLKLLDG